MGGRMLPRLLSSWKVASRRQAEELVAHGRVTVDGRVVRDVCAIVGPRAEVRVDGRLVGESGAAPTWLALNKPRGVVTTTRDPEGRQTVLDLVEDPVPGLAPVGRLDRDTGGLILLTDEHALAARLLDPQSHVTKIYRAKVGGLPDEVQLEALERPVVLGGERLGPLEVRVLVAHEKSAWLEVALAEGKNRQVRRQLAHVGLPVEVLVRVRFGPIELGQLAPGVVRLLNADEVGALREAARGG